MAIIRQYVGCHPECDVLYQLHFSDFLALAQCCRRSVGALRCTDGRLLPLDSGEQKRRSLSESFPTRFLTMEGKSQLEQGAAKRITKE